MGHIIFISGGVRSGKSSLAEKIAASKRQPGQPLIYLACGIDTDPEMRRRIQKHQHDRQLSDESWQTIECSGSLHEVVDSIPPDSIVLLDCVTTLLTNIMFAPDGKNGEEAYVDICQSIKMLMHKVRILVVVSNELFSDFPPEHKDVLSFLKILGSIHRSIVGLSTISIDMSAGIPDVKKGVLSL
ncbi:bifunctional adenosylcobinamide kinase/adenosylcobinamide-phosphate guanylyltransferase [Bacillus sp. KH172YL63]|uniref:bifunctional adenosylcobinamide kinase/adenosylcobinamide-phosphate guanylyltransferase n=1 Tax=Bacillus sp. KH172YL63 TaxID=2709784 RepID=UPI0013E42052|nr:bifunctional adenosylcobinamide kinase/adenosylcobinamide-phosphate guanylyltransferase [Bacillus sp. KH172YL63]BCB03895.1 adenosylcobinamide kinase/adenosylcobinamide phosphate guanyltransferase [Bacillus sp. KH172YL63]